MIRIAVTGNIGTGKTTVCKVFESLGIQVYYADIEAKKLYDIPSVIQAVSKQVGNEIINADGKADTGKLARIVFSDKQKLERLNAIIHPLVLDDYLQWSESLSGEVYTIYESALLFESGFYKHFDRSVLVTAPAELGMERVLQRDGMSKDEFNKRLSMQMEESRKQELADHIIANDQQSPLIPRIIELHNIFLSF